MLSRPARQGGRVLAGGELLAGAGDFWTKQIRTPTLYVHGNADPTVDYRFGQLAYDHTPPPRFLVTILGGDHGTPYTGNTAKPQAKVVVDATLDFFGYYLGGDAGGLERLSIDADVASVARLASER